MKSFKSLLILILLVLSLSSCNNSTNPPTPPESDGEGEIVNPNPDPGEDLPPDSSDEKPGEEEKPDVPKYDFDISKMYKLSDSLYVSKAPGIYSSSEDFSIKFYTTSDNSRLYYSMNKGTVEISDSTVYKFSTPLNVSLTSYLDPSIFPLFTSVDGLLDGYGKPRCYSYRFIDNIQNGKNYKFLPKQRIITIKYFDYDTDTILSRTLSYYLSDEELTIPVVFLSIDQTDFLSFYNNIYEDIDKRCYLEYYDPLYNESFSLNSKIKLGGNWSKGYPQRTLNLNFNKDEYGNKNEPVNVHLFKENKMELDNSSPLSNFTRFRLHNGGNGFEDFVWFNDAVIQNAMIGTFVSTTSYRPCITYINGEYFGLYAIREHYSDTFFSDNYGIKKSNIGVYELKGNISYDDGEECDTLLNNLLDFINTHDLRDDSNYLEFVNNYIDVYSLIDFLICESYCCNWDCLGNFNNMKMWITTKVNTDNPYQDMKWRFGLHDCDFAFTSNEEYLSKYNIYSYSKFPLVGSLLTNETFKGLLLDRAEELLRTNLSSSNLIEIITSMKEEVKTYKYDSMMLYGSTSIDYNTWLTNIDNLITFVENRSSNYLYNLKNILKEY